MWGDVNGLSDKVVCVSEPIFEISNRSGGDAHGHLQVLISKIKII